MVDTSRLMPNFFILGAKRSGTASIAHYLEQHPSFHFTEPRDPSFFLHDELYQQGIDYYVRSFTHNGGGKRWLGEASSSYFAYPHIVGPRLRDLYNDQPLKFITLLREPVSRAWSHYLTRVHHGYEKRDFATALAQESPEPKQGETCYFAEGCYSHLLEEWLTYYPLENFMFLLSEDLADNPLTQMRRIFVWMGVDTTMPVNVGRRLNSARYSRSPQIVDFLNHPPKWIRTACRQIWPERWQRQRIRHRLRQGFQTPYGQLPLIDPMVATDLRQRYRSDILALSKVLGRYLSHWLVEDELWEEPLAQGTSKTDGPDGLKLDGFKKM